MTARAMRQQARRCADRYRVKPGKPFRIRDWDPRDTWEVADKDEGARLLTDIQARLSDLQEILYAQSEHALLVVLQAMDTGGKDGVIRRVFGPLNPQGVRVTSFKVPTPDELAHDFLWRIHAEVPRRGMIRVFNRSHYEDVLVTRVHKLVPAARLRERYKAINDFEHYLTQNGVTILKIFLHISRDEQRERLQARLDNPDKHWKFNPGDLAERARWDDYRDAYERAITACGTAAAPWYVVPADRKWVRDLVVARLALHVLEGLDLRYPPSPPELEKLVIPA